MKKVLFILMVLLVAMPAMAAQTITVTTAATNLTGTIGWSGNGAAGATRARAFALVLTASGGATFTGISGFKTGVSTQSSPGYGIFPGSIQIDPNTGNVTNYKTPIEPNTLPGGPSALNSSQIVVALGSLYSGADTNSPGTSGTLFSYTVSAPCTVTVAVESTYRGGVIGEDANAMAVTFSPSASIVHTAANPHANTLWDATHCPAQPKGDANCDGKVNAFDLNILKASWLKKFGQTSYNCGANFQQTANGSVNAFDLNILKANWLKTGLGGGDGTLTCPTTE